MTTCPSCKSPIDVPEGHAAGTIRCGICWAEVPVDAPIRELTPITLEAVIVPPPVGPVDPFQHFPGKTAPGFAPLEKLLRHVHARMPSLYKPVKVKASKPALEPPPATESRRHVESSLDEDGLRRKRGASRSSLLENYVEVQEPPEATIKPFVWIFVALVVFAGAFFAIRYLF